jgi:LuxR family transcriptional regulator, maltose regulon positive regulatory protein
MDGEVSMTEHVSLIRPRLLNRLESARHHRLTLLTAAAGYGKTTLLEQWQPARALRLSLTTADSDPQVFRMHLLTALDEHYPQARTQVTAASPEHLAAELLNAMATCAREMTVILDGYEHIAHQALIEQAVEYAPPTLHLVIATRRRPDLPLGRLRARGLLLEQDATDLAFTLEETTDYLAQACGATVEASTALYQCTQGWAVGLRRGATLLADGLRAAEVARYLEGDTTLALYLNTAAFAYEPRLVKEALLAAADMETLDTKTYNSAVLERLEDGHLFVTSQNDGMCYRLLPLYAAFLRRRAALQLEYSLIR